MRSRTWWSSTTDLASAGASRQDIDLIWGAVLTRYLTLVKFAGYGNVRSSGPRADAHARPHRGARAGAPGVHARGLLGDQGRLRRRCGQRPHGRRRAGRVRGAARHGSLQERGRGPGRHGARAGRHVRARWRRSRRRSARWQPPAPFNTTSLMAAASAEGLSPARTMRIAESLYMDGYISYPRVDNTVYPPSLDLAETVKRICGQPGLRAVLHRSCWRSRQAHGDARQEGDHRPSAHLSYERGHARRPAAGGIQAVQPGGAPLLGHAFRSGRGGGHARVPGRGGRDVRRAAATC